MHKNKSNKPKHNLFRNTGYAIEGLVDIIKNETSFKWQILMLIILGTIAWSLQIEFVYSCVLFISIFIPVLAEVANSAIERVVDLVTNEYHLLAKQAKDAGATLVFMSFLVMGMIWICVLLIAYKIV